MTESFQRTLTFTLQHCPSFLATNWKSSVVSLGNVRGCGALRVSWWLTDGAVFTRPALVAVALALPADAVVDAAWVTVPLLTFWSRPSLLAVTPAAEAGAMGAAVHHTHLCSKTQTCSCCCVRQDNRPFGTRVFCILNKKCWDVCWEAPAVKMGQYVWR